MPRQQRAFLALSLLTLPVTSSCSNEEIAPNFAAKWHSEFGYDVGIGAMWPDYAREREWYLGLGCSHRDVRAEAGVIRWFEGEIGCGAYWGAKLIAGAALSSTDSLAKDETFVGYELQIGMAGHTPALALGIGNLWAPESDRVATFVAAGMNF